MLLAWREAAVQREKRQAERRQEQLLQLRQEVALRLLQHQTKQLKLSNTSDHMQQSNEPKQQSTHIKQLDISNYTINQRKEEEWPNLFDQFNSRTLHISEEPLPQPSEVFSTPLPRSEEYSRPLPQSKEPLPHSEVYSRPLPRSEVYSRVTAMARGFLTRRLLQGSKTSTLIATITVCLTLAP